MALAAKEEWGCKGAGQGNSSCKQRRDIAGRRRCRRYTTHSNLSHLYLYLAVSQSLYLLLLDSMCFLCLCMCMCVWARLKRITYTAHAFTNEPTPENLRVHIFRFASVFVYLLSLYQYTYIVTHTHTNTYDYIGSCFVLSLSLFAFSCRTWRALAQRNSYAAHRRTSRMFCWCCVAVAKSSIASAKLQSLAVYANHIWYSGPHQVAWICSLPIEIPKLFPPTLGGPGTTATTATTTKSFVTNGVLCQLPMYLLAKVSCRC